jgi:MFS family permease
MHYTDPPAAPSAAVPAHEGPWWRMLNGYQWFVFLVAALGWLFDCLDQQLFNLARAPAISDLLHVHPSDEAAKTWSGLATMIFMLGWATGGIIFGILGDRVGRARTMVMTILLYSLFTGLSALAVGVWDFSLYRFLSGLGVGGQFAVGVSLVAEVMPDRARPHALGWLQALSAIGNVTAALIAMAVGRLKVAGVVESSWRPMFVVGVLPALLAVVVMMRLREPERWKKAAAEGAADHRLGSLRELFGDPQLRRNAIVGLLLASAGVIGLWGIGFYCFELIRAVLNEQGMEEGDKTYWVGIGSLLLNGGAFFGIYAFSRLTAHTGRKPAFAVSFLLALVSTAMAFWFFRGVGDIFWLIPLMGFGILSLFGGYAIYFPELFPTRLRSTGTSFCYNVGRYVSAPGPLLLNLLAAKVYGGYGNVLSYRYAGLTMCSVFLIGLLALLLAPETKGQPLPE